LRHILGSRRAEAPLGYFLLAGIAAGLVLRVVGLGRQSLWVDEIITLKNSHLGEQGILSSFFTTLQGPLVSLVMHFWGALNTGDAFLRIPFAVAGCLTVAATYLLARSLCDAWSTRHTLFLVSLSPMLVWYSQEIRGYSFVVLFTVLMTYFFVQWLARPTTRNAFFYGLMVFAGLISNLSASFVAISHLIYMVLTPARRKMIPRWAVAIFIVLLVFSPWVREIIERSHPDDPFTAGASSEVPIGGGGISLAAIPYAYFTYGLGYTFGPSVRALQADRGSAVRDNLGWIALGSVVLLVPLAIGIAALARSDTNLLTLLLVWGIVPVALVALLAGLGLKAFNVRYALVALPACALLAGRGLAVITRTRFWPFLPLFAALLCLSLYNYFAVADYGKEDSRAVARSIREDIRAGDVVVAAYTGEALAYYLKSTTEVKFFEADDIVSPDAIEARCRDIAAGADRVWLALCRESMIDRRGTIKKWFDGNLDPVRSGYFPGIRLYLYQERGE
jgi:4-amino-4-deoxy-L-arabinose transferase-like glycosyltransferase